MFNQVYNCSDYSWIDEDIVYSMRCNIFHEGVPKVDKNKITKEINKADVFFVGVGDSSCLTKTDTKFVINDGELKPVKRCMISSAYLSRLLFEAGKKYYIDNKEKFNKDNSMCDYYSCDNLFMLMKKQN